MQKKIILPLSDAYSFAKRNGLDREVDLIKKMDVGSHIPAKRNRTVKKGYLVSLLQEKGLWSAFVQQYWRTGSTLWGKQRTDHYLLWKLRNEQSQPSETVFIEGGYSNCDWCNASIGYGDTHLTITRNLERVDRTAKHPDGVVTVAQSEVVITLCAHCESALPLDKAEKIISASRNN